MQLMTLNLSRELHLKVLTSLFKVVKTHFSGSVLHALGDFYEQSSSNQMICYMCERIVGLTLAPLLILCSHFLCDGLPTKNESI